MTRTEYALIRASETASVAHRALDRTVEVLGRCPPSPEIVELHARAARAGLDARLLHRELVEALPEEFEPEDAAHG